MGSYFLGATEILSRLFFAALNLAGVVQRPTKASRRIFDAVLVQLKLDSAVKYDVKNGVVTLNGKVNSQSKRAWVENLASSVPNVKQVVNELEVKGQKATSSD